MARRSDPQFRQVAAWAPATGLGADFGESLVTGGLLAGAIITLDYTVMGAWCDYGSMAFVIFGCVTLSWLRLRVVGGRAVGANAPSETVEGPRERLVMVNPRPTQDAQEEREASEFAQFVRGCSVDTSLRRWESSFGREAYERYRDVLLDGGWAEWRSKDRRQGWRLTEEPESILDACE